MRSKIKPLFITMCALGNVVFGCGVDLQNGRQKILNESENMEYPSPVSKWFQIYLPFVADLVLTL